MNFKLIVALSITALVAASSLEGGTYVNPNPRLYDNCEVQDLVQLSACCNDVLSKLDDCKANDLACECCALQSMKKECYGLCPGNPSNNFLTALFDDCESLNDVNACNLPFKKDDSIPIENTKRKKYQEEEENTSIILKSKVQRPEEPPSEYIDNEIAIEDNEDDGPDFEPELNSTNSSTYEGIKVVVLPSPFSNSSAYFNVSNSSGTLIFL